MSTTTPSTELRPIHADPGVFRYLGQMWRRRHLATAIPMEEIRVSHQNTVLGNLWHLGNPLLTVGVYYLIFGVVLEASRGVDNFILWLTIGVFTYHLTTKTVMSGAKSISGNQGLMRSIRFPRALLPVSVVIEKMITFGFELAVLAVLALVTGETISLRWLVLPAILVLHTVLNLGGAFYTARMNDSFQDLQQIIPFVFRLGGFMSGVMFPLTRFTDSDVPEWIKSIVLLNPMIAILDLYRWVFLGLELDLVRFGSCVVFSIALLISGFLFFRSAESRYGRAR
jgi:teichoic acid transport system permease protein